MTETKTLLEVLRVHYIKPAAARNGNQPGGVFVQECGINGPARQTRADALYVGFTSTSGRLLVGHELKVSRSDWRHELDRAGKADFWADACHEWWIVAPGPAVVPADEVPAGWGLLYPGRSTRMQVVVKAHRKGPDHSPPWDAVRSLIARLDTIQRITLAEGLHDADQKAREALEQRHAAQLERAQESGGGPEAQARLAALDRLEDALGTTINTWFGHNDGVSPEIAAAALRLAVSADAMVGRGHGHRYQVDALRDAAQAMADGLDAYAQARDDLLKLTAKRNR